MSKERNGDWRGRAGEGGGGFIEENWVDGNGHFGLYVKGLGLVRESPGVEFLRGRMKRTSLACLS